jgi:hypothetical protein
MEKKNLRNALMDEFGSHMMASGFTSWKGKWLQKFERGLNTCYPLFVSHRSDFDVVLNVEIQFHDWRQDTGARLQVKSGEPQSKAYLGGELGNLSGTGQQRWTVAKASDLAGANQSMVAMFGSVALPYFNKYDNPTNALNVLERDDRSAWAYNPVHVGRAESALWLCAMTENKSRFDEIFNAKKAFLQVRGEPKIEEFLAYSERLREEFYPPS